MKEDDLLAIEARLRYTFSNRELLKCALTHRSYVNEHRQEAQGHNERLEFLGDAVLELIISQYFYRHLPYAPEGHLSHLRSYVIGAEACVRYARALEVESFLRLGRGESENVGRGRGRILADLFEAVMGAIFLDGGITVATQFFLTHFSQDLHQVMQHPLRNWKADLQDFAQKTTQKPPHYAVVDVSGPPHQPTFTVAVSINHCAMGHGEGRSKKGSGAGSCRKSAPIH